MATSLGVETEYTLSDNSHLGFGPLLVRQETHCYMEATRQQVLDGLGKRLSELLGDEVELHITYPDEKEDGDDTKHDT